MDFDSPEIYEWEHEFKSNREGHFYAFWQQRGFSRVFLDRYERGELFSFLMKGYRNGNFVDDVGILFIRADEEGLVLVRSYQLESREMETFVIEHFKDVLRRGEPIEFMANQGNISYVEDDRLGAREDGSFEIHHLPREIQRYNDRGAEPIRVHDAPVIGRVGQVHSPQPTPDRERGVLQRPNGGERFVVRRPRAFMTPYSGSPPVYAFDDMDVGSSDSDSSDSDESSDSEGERVPYWSRSPSVSLLGNRYDDVQSSASSRESTIEPGDHVPWPMSGSLGARSQSPAPVTETRQAEARARRMVQIARAAQQRAASESF
jgi:hypothetical protein